MAASLEAVGDAGRPMKAGLEPGRALLIGRGEKAQLRLVEEPALSRAHAEARLDGEVLRVRRLEGAANPLFYKGEAREEVVLGSGEHFVIGRTRFWFRLAAETGDGAPEYQHTLHEKELYALGGTDRLKLLDLLELPELLRTKSEEEFFLHVAALLRLATGARETRVATEDGRTLGEDSADDRASGFAWSKRLVAAALKEAPRPTLFRWSAGGEAQATVREGVDWAACAAARVPGEPAIVFYIAGSGGADEAALQENARLVGLIADMTGRTLSVRRLESRERRLERFFAGPVIERILEGDAKALDPRVAQSTVLFFDIRGFSKRTEGKNEKILEYIGELRRAMTAMTEEIFKENGVVLQYMGDGILACWNVPLEDAAHVDRACRAALAMAARLGGVTGGWRCGIGIHTGEVVAGAIGSEQLFSYGLLGAVVNQASRIEGITKAVETPILVSRDVAEKVSAGAASTVRVGRFQPAGMTAALDLFELSAPGGDPARAEALAKGLAAFEAGDWERAYDALDALPSSDRPARYLKSLAEQNRRHPPKDWRGVIELSEK